MKECDIFSGGGSKHTLIPPKYFQGVKTPKPQDIMPLHTSATRPIKWTNWYDNRIVRPKSAERQCLERSLRMVCLRKFSTHVTRSVARFLCNSWVFVGFTVMKRRRFVSSAGIYIFLLSACCCCRFRDIFLLWRNIWRSRDGRCDVRGSYVGAMPSMDRGAGTGGGDGGATALMTMPFHDLERLSAVADSIPAAKRRLSGTGAMQQTDTNGNNLPPLYYGELTGKYFVVYFLKSILSLDFSAV